MNILEQNNVSDFFSGLDHIHIDKGYHYLYRLNSDLIQYYKTLGEVKSIRARCSAGVSCCFKTQSNSLELSYLSLEGARRYYSFDLYVNKLFVKSIEGKTSENEQTIAIDFEHENSLESENTIELYFPQSRVLGISKINIEDATPIEKIQKTYLALGDSITQGMDAVKPSSSYAVQLSRHIEHSLVNHGLGGHIFDEKSVSPLAKQPDLITIAYGTNDFSAIKSEAELKHNIEQYFKKVIDTFPNCPTYVLTPIWRGDERNPNAYSAKIRDIRRFIQDSAQNNQLEVIDGLELVPNQSSFFVDGVHPNDEGFLHYALGIAKHLK